MKHGTCPICGTCYEEHKMIPCENRYTLDGQPVDIDDFVDVNGFGPADWDQIACLPVGEEIIYGGGAAATFILKRIA